MLFTSIYSKSITKRNEKNVRNVWLTSINRGVFHLMSIKMENNTIMRQEARLDTMHTILLTNLHSLDAFDVEGANKIKYLHYAIFSYLKLIRNLMKLHKA